MRFGSYDLDDLIRGLTVSSADGRWRGERPGQRRDAQQRLALFAKGGLRNHVCAASLVIKQDGLDDRLQIAPDTGAVVVENLCDTVDVIAARIAGDEPLDELAANERPDVLVVKMEFIASSRSCKQ